MEMIKEMHKVLRLLMRLLDRAWKYSIRKDSNLLVLLCKESHPSDKLTCTIAAAGPWAPSHPIETVMDETLSYLQLTGSLPVSASVCKSVDTEELSLFVNSSGPLHFALAFQVGHVNPCWQKERHDFEAFLHRISLVRAQMKIFFKFKDHGKTHQRVFGDIAYSKTLLNNQNIIMDIASYQLCPFSEGGLLACDQMHAVVGVEVPLLLPPQLLETGLGGEASIITMAALGPCMDQYPNWPTRLATIQVLVYSPCSLPLQEAYMAAPLSFLRALPGRLHWGELGLFGVTCTEQQQQQAEEEAAPGGPRLCCDMVFNVEDHEREQEAGSKWNPTVMQTLTLFLFVKHSDPFHSQLSDIMASEEMLEKHVDQVLWHNSDRMITSLQLLLEKALKPYHRKCSNQLKMQQGLSVILSSLTSVVNSSSAIEFRTACLDTMKVEDTHQLSTSLERSLHSVTGRRFTPFHRCTSKKPDLGAGDSFSLQKPEGEDGIQVERAEETDSEASLVSCTAKRQQTAPSADESPLCKQRLTEASQVQENLPPPSPDSQSQLSVRGTTSVTLTTDVPTKTKQEDSQWLQAVEGISEWD